MRYLSSDAKTCCKISVTRTPSSETINKTPTHQPILLYRIGALFFLLHSPLPDDTKKRRKIPRKRVVLGERCANAWSHYRCQYTAVRFQIWRHLVSGKRHAFSRFHGENRPHARTGLVYCWRLLAVRIAKLGEDTEILSVPVLIYKYENERQVLSVFFSAVASCGPCSNYVRSSSCYFILACCFSQQKLGFCHF